MGFEASCCGMWCDGKTWKGCESRGRDFETGWYVKLWDQIISVTTFEAHIIFANAIKNRFSQIFSNCFSNLEIMTIQTSWPFPTTSESIPHLLRKSSWWPR